MGISWLMHRGAAPMYSRLRSRVLSDPRKLANIVCAFTTTYKIIHQQIKLCKSVPANTTPYWVQLRARTTRSDGFPINGADRRLWRSNVVDNAFCGWTSICKKLKAVDGLFVISLSSNVSFKGVCQWPKELPCVRWKSCCDTEGCRESIGDAG